VTPYLRQFGIGLAFEAAAACDDFVVSPDGVDEPLIEKAATVAAELLAEACRQCPDHVLEVLEAAIAQILFFQLGDRRDIEIGRV
jgi:hypothetical protein